MPRNVPDAINELLLAFPEVTETRAHGAPTFKVAGKTFAHLAINHHGDGRYAVWLRSPPGMQDEWVARNPENYFVPPYLGSKGWIGLDLGRDCPWEQVLDRVREAWLHTAPSTINPDPVQALQVPPPEVAMRPEEINPMLGAHAQAVLGELASRVGCLPEGSFGTASGNPAGLAGRKVFLRTEQKDGRLSLLFMVGVEQQGLFTMDPRYSIPLYFGSSGWIALDVQELVNWEEIQSLLEQSYRHFALKRMLKALDAAQTGAGI